MLIPVCFYMYVNLLTQIPNIRKMILCGLYAAIYFEMYKSFSGVSSWTHSAHVPFSPPPSLHLQVLSQIETVEMLTARLKEQPGSFMMMIQIPS